MTREPTSRERRPFIAGGQGTDGRRLVSAASGWAQPVAILLANFSQNQDLGAQSVYKRVLIRNNLIKHVDGVTDASGLPLGIVMRFCQDAIVEDNVIDLGSLIPIQYYKCDAVSYFNNRSPAGGLIQGVDLGQTGYPKHSELTTDVEDAQI